MRNSLFFISFCFLLCCNSPRESTIEETDSKSTLKPKYATGFQIDYYDGYKIVTVDRPHMNAKKGFKYILAEEVDQVPEHLSGETVIQIPLSKMVCTSTTHIPLLDYLNESDKLIGFPTTDYISSKTMRMRIDSGLVKDLGVDKEMNIELLAELGPDAVMAYTINGDYGQFNKIAQLGIPTIINAEYLEEHPLGRAEWLKFTAAFFNKEALADSIFTSIETNYNQLKSKASTISTTYRVLSGVVYGDTWYLPGGQNYAAKLIADANANYLWEEDSTRGFLELSFEAVYEKAHKADYWIGVASFETLENLANADARYAEFDAFKNHRIYTNNWRKGDKGGSEFLELGYLRPDIILQDLIKIMHPNLLDNKELYFHKNLVE